MARKNIYIPDELDKELERLFKNQPELVKTFNLSEITQKALEEYIKENTEEKIVRREINL